MKSLLVTFFVAGVFAIAQDRSEQTAQKDQRQKLIVLTPHGPATVKADLIRQSKDGKTVYLRGHASITTLNRATAPPTVVEAEEADIHLDTGVMESRQNSESPVSSTMLGGLMSPDTRVKKAK